jgi:hypothetical protein
MPIALSLQAKQILDKEGAAIVSQVRQSLSDKNISKSGKTAASLRNETKDNYNLEVWGREDIDNVESGVSPSQAKKKSADELRPMIYDWSKYLPIEFSTSKKRMAFASTVTANLRTIGSKLYREGGRKDIYTDKANEALTRLADKLGQAILNYEIL